MPGTCRAARIPNVIGPRSRGYEVVSQLGLSNLEEAIACGTNLWIEAEQRNLGDDHVASAVPRRGVGRREDWSDEKESTQPFHDSDHTF